MNRPYKLYGTNYVETGKHLERYITIYCVPLAKLVQQKGCAKKFCDGLDIQLQGLCSTPEFEYLESKSSELSENTKEMDLS